MPSRLLPFLLVLVLFSVSFFSVAAQSPDDAPSAAPSLNVLSHSASPASFVFVSAPYAFAANTTTVSILDISDPFAPALLSESPLPAGSTVVGMARIADHLYVRSFACDAPGSPICQNRIQILNIANPAAPQPAGSYGLAFPSAYYSQKEGLAAVGTRLFVPDGNLLRVWDVSDPAAIVEVGTTEYGTGTVTAITARDGLVYLTVPDKGVLYLHILDFTDPDNFSGLETLKLPGVSSVRGLTVAGGFAYLIEPQRATVGSRVRIIDVTDPETPVERGEIGVAGDVSSVAVQGTLASLAYSPGAPATALQIVDISDPAQPQPVGSFGAGQHLALSGDHLFVAGGPSGLFILGDGASGAFVTGRVTDAGGAPVSGVTLATGPTLTATTDATGAYTLTNILSGTYTLTPTLDGFAFLPPTRTLSVPPSARDQSFTILPAPISTTLEPGITTTLTLTDARGLTSTLLFPAGAVNQPTPLTLTPTVASLLPNSLFAGHAWELTAYDDGQPLSGFTFARPVTVTISYLDTHISAASDEAALMAWWHAGATWREAHDTCPTPTPPTLDTEANRLTVSLCRAGSLTLAARANHFFLPLLHNESQN